MPYRNRTEGGALIPKILVTEEQWVYKGMEQFAERGVDGLIIEQMASDLGCSKSSFYWYFKNRQEFIVRVIEHWREQATQQVIHESSAAEQPGEQLTRLLKEMVAVTQKGDFLFYLRKLGREHAAAQAILEEIELTRMQFAQELLQRLGMSTEAAAHKSAILYHYYLGWYERHKHAPIPPDEVAAHISMLREHLLGI